MKIKIEENVFDILERIKEIDEGYFVLFDTSKNCYELHNANQPTTYCLTIPYDTLDSRVIELILYSDISNIDSIMQDIDNNNIKIEEDANNEIKSQTDYMVREIYDFCNNSSKKFDCNSFKASWR